MRRTRVCCCPDFSRAGAPRSECCSCGALIATACGGSGKSTSSSLPAAANSDAFGAHWCVVSPQGDANQTKAESDKPPSMGN